jgi:UDP-4-amino-4-deoxy-L-arabinose formyltransferase/UDP-glucuronic acid dehydrogenase (UDP-4-keto-hexauronic acid decarboxylating)
LAESVSRPHHPLRVVLAADEAAGLRAFHAIVESGHTLVRVLAPTASDARRGSAVADVARDRGFDLWPADRVKDPSLAEDLRTLEVDLLLNVHSLFLFHPAVVGAPRIGSFNLHPGPLPEYAGLNAPSWAVFHGAASHAVTLHWMLPDVDTGDVAYEARFPLTDADTGLTVSSRCVREGIPLIVRLLDDAAAMPPRVPSRPQDLSRRRVFKRRDVPNGGRIDWSRPAREIDAFVRAADYHPLPSPWGHPLAIVEGREVRVARTVRTGRNCDRPPGSVQRGAGVVEVATGDEWLVLKRIKVGNEYVDPAVEQG